MKAIFSTLADAANAGENGKLNILGVFQAIFAPSVPFNQGQLTLAVVMQAERSDMENPGQSHSLRIQIVNPDGAIIWQPPKDFYANVEFDGTFPELFEGLPTFTFIVNVLGVPFRNFGVHHVQITINNKIIHELPLYVIRNEGGAKQ